MIDKVIASATSGKKLAQEARKKGQLDRAIVLIEGAIKALEVERGRLDTVKKGALSSDNLRLAEALADVYGSSGGIYRSAAMYQRSIEAYDSGFEIEKDDRFGFVNSYNLTQRLVARVMADPARWIEEGEVIAGERFPTCLQTAQTTVEEQTRGPRSGDAWAWADLGVLSLLLRQSPETAWQEMAFATRQPHVFDSTSNVIDDLLKRITPVANNVPHDHLRAVEVALREARDSLRVALSQR